MMRKNSEVQRNSPSDWEGKNSWSVNYVPCLFGFSPNCWACRRWEFSLCLAYWFGMWRGIKKSERICRQTGQVCNFLKPWPNEDGSWWELALMRVFVNSHRLSWSVGQTRENSRRLSWKIWAGSNSMRTHESRWECLRVSTLTPIGPDFIP